MTDDILDFEFDESKEDLGTPEPVVEQFVSNVLLARNLAIFNPCDLHGSLKVLTFEVKADKDYIEGSTFSLCKIPQSQVRILGALSRIKFNLSCKSAVMGWPKFKKRNQMYVESNYTGFGKVSELKGTSSFLESAPAQTTVLDSLEGVYIVCTAGSAGKKGDTIKGYLIYVKQ